jgi:hypothetical protein
MREVTCPACGGLIEEPDDQALVAEAQIHALEAHQYQLSREHVLQAAHDVDEND